MALSPCNECKREISSSAKACPHCGKPNPTHRRIGAIGFVVGGIMLIGVIQAIAGSSSPTTGPAGVTQASAPVISATDRAKADSILSGLTASSAVQTPDSSLAFVLKAADSMKALTNWQAVKREQQRRAEQRAESAKVDAVLAEAKSSRTVEGGGCSRATRGRALRLVQAHRGWPTEVLSAVMCGFVQEGMTAEQLKASWGAPERNNRSVGSWGVHEQWVYPSNYVYLANGKVTSWQSSR